MVSLEWRQKIAEEGSVWLVNQGLIPIGQQKEVRDELVDLADEIDDVLYCLLKIYEKVEQGIHVIEVLKDFKVVKIFGIANIFRLFIPFLDSNSYPHGYANIFSQIMGLTNDQYKNLAVLVKEGLIHGSYRKEFIFRCVKTEDLCELEDGIEKAFFVRQRLSSLQCSREDFIDIFLVILTVPFQDRSVLAEQTFKLMGYADRFRWNGTFFIIVFSALKELELKSRLEAIERIGAFLKKKPILGQVSLERTSSLEVLFSLEKHTLSSEAKTSIFQYLGLIAEDDPLSCRSHRNYILEHSFYTLKEVRDISQAYEDSKELFEINSQVLWRAKLLREMDRIPKSERKKVLEIFKMVAQKHPKIGANAIRSIFYLSRNLSSKKIKTLFDKSEELCQENYSAEERLSVMSSLCLSFEKMDFTIQIMKRIITPQDQAENRSLAIRITQIIASIFETKGSEERYEIFKLVREMFPESSVVDCHRKAQLLFALAKVNSRKKRNRITTFISTFPFHLKDIEEREHIKSIKFLKRTSLSRIQNALPWTKELYPENDMRNSIRFSHYISFIPTSILDRMVRVLKKSNFLKLSLYQRLVFMSFIEKLHLQIPDELFSLIFNFMNVIIPDQNVIAHEGGPNLERG